MGLPNLYFLLLLFSLLSFLQTPTSAAKKPYVVYLGSHSHGSNPTSDDIDRARIRHHEFLGSFLGSVEEAESSIFHSYGRFINGFGAVLEEEHAKQLENHPGVVSVFPDEGAKLHTTRSWDFLGLEKDNFIPPDSAWKKARFGEDVIIANVDSGVWPESKSFADDGMGPIPSKWKGICQNDNYKGVSCNKKLIGIRYINQGTIEELRAKNPDAVIPQNLTTGRDEEGHGTHTLATAGGNFVPNVSVYGSGYGTAKGGSPKARVAAYKVCWKPNENDSCASADILSAYDLAIHDGVDVISASLGSIAREHLKNTIAIGSFHAMMNGIVSVAAAGNSGPDDGSVENVAPWILTVGASTTDREFTSYVALGNKMVIKGASVSQKGLLNDLDSYPLIGGADARIANVSEIDASECKKGSIDPAKVQGKILICYGARYGDEKGQWAAQAGAVGMILVSSKESGNKVLNMVHHLPTAHLNYTDGESVYAYINSTQNPTASMTNSKTEFNTRPSRMMAFFTSRGPNMIDPAIFKPDVTAPGVDIIAAFTEASGPSPDETDKRRIPYIMMSGTSMSCPHVAGIVGLVKTLHPDWSSAAIKSAIMTTARAEDLSNRPILDQNTGEKATPFAYGAGHVNPNSALDPGLVYDLTFEDYLGYICDRGYNQSTINLFTAPKKFTCPKSFNLADFNYPSIAVPKLNGTITFTRKVKNVGAANSTYKARTSEITGVSTIVEPSILNFTKYGEEKTFKVTFSVKGDDKPTDYVFGDLVWSDGFHDVRSPIAVKLHQGFSM